MRINVFFLFHRWNHAKSRVDVYAFMSGKTISSWEHPLCLPHKNMIVLNHHAMLNHKYAIIIMCFFIFARQLGIWMNWMQNMVGTFKGIRLRSIHLNFLMEQSRIHQWVNHQFEPSLCKPLSNQSDSINILK